MANADVLIIGAGPTGMALALELSMQNVSYRIIDKAPARSDKSRALIVQARTLELLNRHGTAQKLSSRGFVVRGASVYANKREAGTVLLDGLNMADTEFPLPVCVPQQETEDFLDECHTEYGGSVERLVTVKHISQDKTGVTVRLYNESTHREETVRAKYVIGCDGAHSSVRHAGDFTFEGAPYPQTFMLAECAVSDSNLARDKILLFFGSCTMAMFPLKGERWRIMTIHDDNGQREEHGDVRMDKAPSLEDFKPLFKEMAPRGAGTLHDATWLTKYHLHHRVANKYRDRRLFLVGDASNIHSPAGGQGMNTGMQDAFNLGWKLGRVLRGDADDSLLHTYDPERRPVSENVVNTTDRLFAYATWQNFIWRFCRNLLLPWVLPLLANSKERREAALRYMSEFAVNYRSSPIVHTTRGFSGLIQAGDRLQDGRLRSASGKDLTLQYLCVGPSFHLLLFSGTGSRALSKKEIAEYEAKLSNNEKYAQIGLHHISGPETESKGGYLDSDGAVHRRYGMVKPGYVLVRPDAYVACIGYMETFDELLSLLSVSKFG